MILLCVQGFLQAVYSASFQLVSRRLATNIKNVLFKKILLQDVAYFDGTSSGALLSRLTNDINMLMQPINSSLSLLLSNILMLIGGVVMCYVKSYKLSMLAFVTVGPIMFLWDIYAQWSRSLNRQVLASWGDANAIGKLKNKFNYM